MTRRSDAWVATILLMFCGIFLNDLMHTKGSGAFVKTTTLPTVLVIVLALLSVLLMAGSLLTPAKPDSLAPTDKPRLGAVAVLVVGVALYIAALPWLGYLVASGFFLIGASWLYGNRRWPVILSWAVLLPLALMLFFEKVMIIFLPASRILG